MEYGSPVDLLNKNNGLFRETVMKQGESNFEFMMKLATKNKL